MSDSIELHPAFVWDCDNCGTENFCRGVLCSPEQFDAEEEAELREEHGIDPESIGNWLMAPDAVVCTSCGTEFSTQDWRAPE